jgi:hypothetical protein
MKPKAESEIALEKSSTEIQQTGEGPNAAESVVENHSPVTNILEDDDNDDRKPAAIEVDTKPDTDTQIVEDAHDIDVGQTKDESSLVAAVVSLDEEEVEEVPQLAEVDMEILMTIFGYLDAIDILNTAQINIAMYTRVDTIFGIAEDGHMMPQPAPVAAKKQSKPQKPAMPPASPAKPPPVAAKPVVTTPIDSNVGGTGMGLFSLLQPRATVGRATSQPAKPGRAQPMNANLAKSMASKLTDAELAAIISMTDKLSKLDKEVNFLRNEREGLSAKLEGTESVKQFLIGKVRDVESKMKQREEDDVKVTQQIASDQEVIAFLDTRVQELELSSENVTKEKNSTQDELKAIKVSTSKKTTMLNDMLKYEREKLREEESEWKATKKVLVKEVKNCRAQILALQAERDGFKEQNEMLKRAIVSTGKSASS